MQTQIEKETKPSTETQHSADFFLHLETTLKIDDEDNDGNYNDEYNDDDTVMSRKGTTARFIEDQDEKREKLVQFFCRNIHNK